MFVEVPRPDGSRNLILGAIRSLEYEDLRPYLVSLRRTGYRGHVCFFADAVSLRTKDWLRGNGVEVREFRSLRLRLPFRPRNKGGHLYRVAFPAIWLWRRYTLRRRGPRPFASEFIPEDALYAGRFLPVHQSRYALYREYLAENRTRYDRVLIADVRDVVFQRDPFADDLGADLACFLEEPHLTIGTDLFSAEEMRRFFGRRVASEFSSAPISCSGVTFGTTEAMLEYLALMTAYLTSPALARNTGFSGGDQAVHNFLILRGWLPRATLVENRKGPVLTMGVMNPASFRRDASNRLLNDDRSVPSVLHQYDRHMSDPSIVALLQHCREMTAARA